MTTNEEADALSRVLDARNGRAPLAANSLVPPQDTALRGLLEAADLAWTAAQELPPLAEDPLAAMLGLLPAVDYELDGKALTTARKSCGLTVSALASRLALRGWSVSAKDIFAWESARGTTSTPAVIVAIADIVEIDADRLRRLKATNADRSALMGTLNSAAFTALAQRWARLQGTTLAMARSALEARLIVAVHRGSAPESEALLASLEAMVGALEDPGQP